MVKQPPHQYADGFNNSFLDYNLSHILLAACYEKFLCGISRDVSQWIEVVEWSDMQYQVHGHDSWQEVILIIT
jgi:hypothetical protein